MKIANFGILTFALCICAGTSCITTTFYKVDFSLSRCPQAKFDIPRGFSRLEETLVLDKRKLDCPSYSSYVYTRYRPSGEAISYFEGLIRLVRGTPCTLEMLVPYRCVKGRTCQKEQDIEIRQRVTEHASALGNVLWSKQEVTVDSNSVRVKKIGDWDELEKLCQGKTANP